MAKFLLGVLAGLVFAVVILVIGVAAIAFSVGKGREKPVTVADGSTLVLRLDGEIPERPPVDYGLPFLQQKSSLTVENIWTLLRKATADKRIKALILEPSSPGAGWAKLQEMHADLEKFRKSGKPIYAFLKTPNARDYYLATAATRIYLPPQDVLDLKGMRFELMYFRRTLDKVGVQVDVEHAGKYKDFGDMFTRTSMSPETQEVLNSLLDDMYGHLLQTIADGRRKPLEEVRAILDEGPFLSKQALAKGLVDQLRFEDEMLGDLKTALKSGEIKKVNERDYLKVTVPNAGVSGKSRIALVVAEGDITRGDPDSSSPGTGIESEHFNKLIAKVQNDAGIKAVIVRINSPGGEVFASDEIWRAMNVLRKKKPVVISMSDEAASGGYYMAMSGDPVVAYPGTVTGSIGVVFGKPNLHGLYDKLGIDKEIMSRGRFARIDSDYEPLSPAGRAKLREGIDEDYRAFVSKVAEARKRKFEEIEPLAQGRVWMGDQARQNGLVDELGGLDKALELIKKKANIPATESVSVVTYPPKRSILDIILQGTGPEAMLDAKLNGVLGNTLRDSHLRLWLRGGMLRLSPFSIQFR